MQVKHLNDRVIITVGVMTIERLCIDATDYKLTDCVHILGELSPCDSLRAYVDSNVFVLPSYTENFGMTVVEALACTLPVVITDQVNIHSEISSNACGVVTPCDIDCIYDGLRHLLSNPLLCVEMGLAGRDLCKRQYSWDSIVNSLTHQYLQILSR